MRFLLPESKAGYLISDKMIHNNGHRKQIADRREETELKFKTYFKREKPWINKYWSAITSESSHVVNINTSRLMDHDVWGLVSYWTKEHTSSLTRTQSREPCHKNRQKKVSSSVCGDVVMNHGRFSLIWSSWSSSLIVTSTSSLLKVILLHRTITSKLE